MTKEKKTILLPHGQLKLLAEDQNISERLASMYLKGWYDEANESVAQRATVVRMTAIEKFGGAEKKD